MSDIATITAQIRKIRNSPAYQALLRAHRGPREEKQLRQYNTEIQTLERRIATLQENLDPAPVGRVTRGVAQRPGRLAQVALAPVAAPPSPAVKRAVLAARVPAHLLTEAAKEELIASAPEPVTPVDDVDTTNGKYPFYDGLGTVIAYTDEPNETVSQTRAIEELSLSTPTRRAKAAPRKVAGPVKRASPKGRVSAAKAKTVTEPIVVKGSDDMDDEFERRLMEAADNMASLPIADDL